LIGQTINWSMRMSFLTALPRVDMILFDPAKADFDLGNAYAMACMCQLSYGGY
jgi:hypothetical protein